MPTSVSKRTEETDFVGLPLESALPIVSAVELWVGGLQEAKASGGPCWRLGDAHAS